MARKQASSQHFQMREIDWEEDEQQLKIANKGTWLRRHRQVTVRPLAGTEGLM